MMALTFRRSLWAGCCNIPPSLLQEGISLNYYRRFPGDYAKDTGHLTLAEHGAYTLLLDHLYSTEKPIASIEDAMRICKVQRSFKPIRKSFEQRLVESVLSEFFLKTDLGFVHKRVEEEIRYASSKSFAAREAAKIRWHRDADALPTHSERNALPDSRLQRPEGRRNFEFPQARAVVALTDVEKYAREQFQIFKANYPKAAWVDEDLVWRAWLGISALDQTKAAESVPLWVKSDRWEESRYVISPLKFIQNRRWETVPSQGRANAKRERTKEAVQRAIQGPRSELV